MEEQRQRTIKEHAEGVQRAFTQLRRAVAANEATVEPKIMTTLETEISKMMMCIAEMQVDGGAVSPKDALF